MSRITETILIVASTFLLTLTLASLLVDPAGPTTIGREYLPVAIAAITTVLVALGIAVDELAHFLNKRCNNHDA